MGSWLYGVLSGFVRRMGAWFGSFRGHGDSRVDADDIGAMKDITVSRDIRTAHERLQKRFVELCAAYKRMFPQRDIIITCVYRSPAEQQRLYKQGRFGNPGPIVTNCDGNKNLSLHNYFPARAIDVAITEGGKTVWREEVYYPLGALAKECGLEWGGFWTKFPDMPHVQLPKGDA